VSTCFPHPGNNLDYPKKTFFCSFYQPLSDGIEFFTTNKQYDFPAAKTVLFHVSSDHIKFLSACPAYIWNLTFHLKK